MKRFFLLLALVAVALPAWAQRGALTVPRNLSQLTDQASVIVRGTVAEVRVEKHPTLRNLSTVVVTLRVRETLKGQVGETFTFRQYIWDIRDRYDGAGYKQGQDLLLLMNRESRYGLSSPTGIEQGRFRILRDKTGKELAVNGHGNFKLFDGMSAHLSKKGIVLSPRYASLIGTQRKGPFEAADLMGMIREMVQQEAE